MKKTSSLALVAAALVAVAGFSAPVLAESGDDTDFNRDVVLSQLQGRGVDASQVEQWGNKIKATVRLADGSTTFQYFDIDTLQPVGGGNAGNSRVLSELDVGAQPAKPSIHSLTWVDPPGGD